MRRSSAGPVSGPIRLADLCLENFEKLQQCGEVDCIAASILKRMRGLLCFVRNSIAIETEALAETFVEKSKRRTYLLRDLRARLLTLFCWPSSEAGRAAYMHSALRERQ
jgi:hypothetical protein